MSDSSDTGRGRWTVLWPRTVLTLAEEGGLSYGLGQRKVDCLMAPDSSDTGRGRWTVLWSRTVLTLAEEGGLSYGPGQF